MSTGAGMLAHTVHYALVVGGLLTLAVVLLPHALDRLRPEPLAPRDQHDLRVLELRHAVAAGTLTVPRSTLTPAAAPISAPLRPSAGSALQLAVVASGAAAAIHAGAGPGHLDEQAVFGGFFVAAALAQLAWAALAATRCTPRLLLAGALGNAAILALWLTTRTWGLPLGLMPQPEAVGVWDLACAGWELLVVASCAHLLGPGRRTAVAS
ncbi:hypothetical protein [Nocardioides sp.]|uniref:hypothetical protein n=1 Tax=Nocardioides sp. TaxID=35761 RepID=UPI00286D3F85|nr:hypothetical protein [Nocardioides sp.]